MTCDTCGTRFSFLLNVVGAIDGAVVVLGVTYDVSEADADVCVDAPLEKEYIGRTIAVCSTFGLAVGLDGTGPW